MPTVVAAQDLDLAPFCDIQPKKPADEMAAGTAYDLCMYEWRPLTAARKVMELDFSQAVRCPTGEQAACFRLAAACAWWPGDHCAVVVVTWLALCTTVAGRGVRRPRRGPGL